LEYNFANMKTKALLLFVCVVALSASTTVPSEDRGAMGLAQALNRLDVVASVLHTGAHPDDENSALLSWLSRGGERARLTFRSRVATADRIFWVRNYSKISASFEPRNYWRRGGGWSAAILHSGI
jgi:hypothetical protein